MFSGDPRVQRLLHPSDDDIEGLDDEGGKIVPFADFGWSHNEEVFLSLQENMALIAANSFEIYKLYQMILVDHDRIKAKLQKTQDNTAEVDLKCAELESRLQTMS